MYHIFDLHCDILDYLEGDPQRTPYHQEARCAIPQLRFGNVKLQTLAIFAETGPESVKRGMAQAQIYKHLPIFYPQDFIHFPFSAPDYSNQIATLLAFEGGSTFCDEVEPIEEGLNRLQWMIKNIAKPLYISFTWNMENRFGGGAHTKIGLKEDGKRLLHFLHEQKTIAVDLSHTSDLLAYDILNYIDEGQLNIPVIASHSNSRAICDVPRNLPDEIAKEIIRRKGLIGLNLYKLFIGPQADESLIQHVAHWLELGGEKSICFGADFFFSKKQDPFFAEHADSSCYGRILNLLQQNLNLSTDSLQNLASQNFSSFIYSLNTDLYPRELKNWHFS